MILSLFFLLACAVATAVKRNQAGLRLGIAGLLLELGFAAFWFTEQAKGRSSWAALAFHNPAVVMILTACLILIIANVSAIRRGNEGDFAG